MTDEGTGQELLTGDHDIDLVLTPGETRELSLASMGTAGFVWTSDLEGDQGVLEVSRRRGAPSTNGSKVAGKATPEQVIISAVAPGEATLRLQQRRPWESGRAPRQSFRVHVAVSGR